MFLALRHESLVSCFTSLCWTCTLDQKSPPPRSPPLSLAAGFSVSASQVVPSDEEMQRKAQMRPQMETFRETLVEAEMRISALERATGLQRQLLGRGKLSWLWRKKGEKWYQ